MTKPIEEVRILPSILDAIILGPVWCLVASPFLGALALGSVFNEGDLEVWLTVFILVAPVVTLSTYPIIKLWLNAQPGGYWGIVSIGGVVGMVCVVTLSLLDGKLPGFDGMILFVILGGIPFGSAYASAIWVSLNLRETEKLPVLRWSNTEIVKNLGLTLVLVWSSQVILLFWLGNGFGQHG